MNGDQLRAMKNLGDDDDNVGDSNSSHYFTEERDSPNYRNSNRFSYTRLLGSLSDIRNKSNRRKYLFITFFILITLICISLLIMIDNTGSKTNIIDVNSSNKISNNLSINTNVNEIVVTQKNVIHFENITTPNGIENNFNKNITELFTSSTQGYEITSQSFNVGSNVVTNNKNTTSLDQNMIELISHPTQVNEITTPSFNIKTTVVTSYSRSSVFDVKHQGIGMKECISNFTKHPKETEFIKKCDQNDSESKISVKTKIRFVMGESLFFICLAHTIDCDHFFDLERARHIKDHGLKDLYFNYIMGQDGFLYEGRHLSCSFNEPFISEDHTEILTVGIRNCYALSSENSVDIDKFNNLLIKFLHCSETSGLLAKNYTIEFHIDCHHLFLTKKVLSSYHDKILYTNDDNLDMEKYFERKNIW